MTNPPRAEVDALDGAGCALRAVFVRQGNLYEHEVHAIAGGVATPLLLAEALPIQEVVDHRAADGSRALLMTGAADGGYWSATVATISDERLAILGFDLARRQKKAATTATLRYRLAAGVAWRDRRLRLADGREAEICPAAMPTSIATELVITCRVDVDDRGVTIFSLDAPHVATPDTSRWRYEIKFVRES